ncbi:MAG: DNA-processing protein DprA [Pseudomonadota bacterium]
MARSRNVGPATWSRLIARFGSAARALEALPDLAARGGAKTFQVCSLAQAEKELEAGQAVGARLAVAGRPDYPRMLAQLQDPPPVVWLRGGEAALARPAAALVGGRNASALGLRLAESMARDLAAAGWCVVSGLARGIDGAAHRGALAGAEAGGTLAVLAGGIDHAYPPEHAALLEEVAEGGGLVSEAPPGLEPQSRHFPRRNRLISGLARGVVLVEAAERSGSLITARYAIEQGRDVAAVPGAPLDPRSEGGNGFIRDGAVLVRHAEDVIEAFREGLGADRALDADGDLADDGGPGAAEEAGGLAEAGSRFARAEADAAAADRRHRASVRALLGLAPVEEDALARLSGAPLAAVAEALLELELAGRLDRRPGGLVALMPE